MIRAEDLKNGHIKKPRARTSILPFLRFEQAEKDNQTADKAEPFVEATKSKQDIEAVKTSLKHIHPTATEAELELMAREVIG